MSFRVSNKPPIVVPYSNPQQVVNNGNIDIPGYYKVNGVPIDYYYYPALSRATAEKAMNTWTNRTGFSLVGNPNPNRSAWSPELGLFAVTTAQTIGRIVTSPDGVNWTKQTTGVNLTNCNNGAGNIITCTSTTGISPGMSILLSSGSGTVPGSTTVSGVIDGLTFITNNTITGLSNSTLVADSQYFGIIWCRDLSGTGMFVASRTTGTGIQIVTSVDGINWIARTTPSSFNDPHMFSYSPQLRRVICGRATVASTAFIYSDDGINWTTVDNPVPSNLFFDSDWSPELGIFCAVAFTGNNQKVITSPDGINWTPISLDIPTSSTWNAIRWSPELGIFCAMSSDYSPNVMISNNGINWQFYSTPSVIEYRSLAWSPQLRVFVAVSQTGTNRLAYSFDGQNWLEKNIGTTSNYRGISWSPELGIFLINGQIGTNIILTSSFKTRPPTSYNVFDSSFNNINELGLWNFQSFSRGIPVLRDTSGTTIAAGQNWTDCSTNDITIVLPTNSVFIGRELMFKNTAARTILSSPPNIILQADGTTSSIILSNVAKTWCTLVFNGTNWVKMKGNNL